MYEILIVDDERQIRDGYAKLLAREGFSTRTAKDGEDALKSFRLRRPDLALLDVMLPKLNGFALCETMRREAPFMPVVFLTAKYSDADLCRGFGCGADAYIDKAEATSPGLLAVRLRSLLGRVEAYRCESIEGPEPLSLAGIKVDFRDGTVIGKGLAERLTRTESDILRLLAREPGRVFTIDEILARIEDVTTILFLRSHVKNLRRKIGAIGPKICNRRGVGYFLDMPPRSRLLSGVPKM